ncbi:hypothetical protein GIB67_003827 [Kingdonia uniflora]|uniref:SMP-LTD domain-containing protein n=1 Tax=Kingdonia uniflora TaxID=39325 RepID=A0A7J7P2Z3_9MAGN|nr:hypothetical protein GIB67_003827 [Kingdonia uniflora]
MTQFIGVSIIEDGGSGGITLELELQWDGNPNIVLDIKMMVGVVLPLKVKNIEFNGVFRLIFKPLVEEFPCVGAISYSLREKKKLDFTLKVVDGDLSSIPGLADAIEGTITDAVEDAITWPVRKVIPIILGNYRDLELKPEGTFKASELLGCAQVRLKDLEPGKVKDVWLKLVKDLGIQRDTKNRGQVHLELLYSPFTSKSGFTKPFVCNYSMTSLEKALQSGTNRAEAIENGKMLSRGLVKKLLMDDMISEDLLLINFLTKCCEYFSPSAKFSNIPAALFSLDTLTLRFVVMFRIDYIAQIPTANPVAANNG